MALMDYLTALLIHGALWRLIARVPGGLFTVLAVIALLWYWRRRARRRGGGRRAYDPESDRRPAGPLDSLTVAYGDGSYAQGGKRFSGRILLAREKLCLSGPEGEIPATFVPAGKIVRLALSGGALRLEVQLSTVDGYEAELSGEPAQLAELGAELVRRRGLKKRWLRSEWYDPEFA